MSRTAVCEFEEALARLEAVEAQHPPEVRRVMREAIEGQLEELRAELVAAIGHASLPDRDISGVRNGRPLIPGDLGQFLIPGLAVSCRHERNPIATVA